MRFFTIFAAITPAVLAQGQNPQGCDTKCYVYSKEAESACPNKAIYREGPGCFQCCDSV